MRRTHKELKKLSTGKLLDMLFDNTPEDEFEKSQTAHELRRRLVIATGSGSAHTHTQ